MTRAKNTPVTRRRRKKILQQAKGYFGSKHKLFKTAKEQLMHAWDDSYAHRKKRPGHFRRLQILRINNVCRKHDLNYSRFIRLLTLAQIKLNRKQLAEMPDEQFTKLIAKLKNPW